MTTVNASHEIYVLLSNDHFKSRAAQHAIRPRITIKSVKNRLLVMPEGLAMNVRPVAIKSNISDPVIMAAVMPDTSQLTALGIEFSGCRKECGYVHVLKLTCGDIELAERTEITQKPLDFQLLSSVKLTNIGLKGLETHIDDRLENSNKAYPFTCKFSGNTVGCEDEFDGKYLQSDHNDSPTLHISAFRKLCTIMVENTKYDLNEDHKFNVWHINRIIDNMLSTYKLLQSYYSRLSTARRSKSSLHTGQILAMNDVRLSMLLMAMMCKILIKCHGSKLTSRSAMLARQRKQSAMRVSKTWGPFMGMILMFADLEVDLRNCTEETVEEILEKGVSREKEDEGGENRIRNFLLETIQKDKKLKCNFRTAIKKCYPELHQYNLEFPGTYTTIYNTNIVHNKFWKSYSRKLLFGHLIQYMLDIYFNSLIVNPDESPPYTLLLNPSSQPPPYTPHTHFTRQARSSFTIEGTHILVGTHTITSVDDCRHVRHVILKGYIIDDCLMLSDGMIVCVVVDDGKKCLAVLSLGFEKGDVERELCEVRIEDRVDLNDKVKRVVSVYKKRIYLFEKEKNESPMTDLRTITVRNGKFKEHSIRPLKQELINPCQMHPIEKVIFNGTYLVFENITRRGGYTFRNRMFSELTAVNIHTEIQAKTSVYRHLAYPSILEPLLLNNSTPAFVSIKHQTDNGPAGSHMKCVTLWIMSKSSMVKVIDNMIMVDVNDGTDSVVSWSINSMSNTLSARIDQMTYEGMRITIKLFKIKV
jgi:hypothetical protein